MNIHMVCHSREQAYECEYCYKTFGTKISRARHTNKLHVCEDRYKCPHCDMKLTLKTSLIRHLGLLHSNKVKLISPLHRSAASVLRVYYRSRDVEPGRDLIMKLLASIESSDI